MDGMQETDRQVHTVIYILREHLDIFETHAYKSRQAVQLTLQHMSRRRRKTTDPR